MGGAVRIGCILAACLAMVLAGHTQGTESGLSWHDTRGNLQSVSQYKGRIVLLNFWATWCVPCQHEMPMLADVQRKYDDKGLVVLGGSVDDSTTQARIDPFAETAKISFPLLVGATTEQMQKLQLGEAVPATAFFDADGKLVARVLGELDKHDLQHRLEWILGKHRGKEPPAFVNRLRKKSEPEPIPSVFTH